MSRSNPGSQAALNFDTAWLDNALLEVNCSASSAVTVETADPTREVQLTAFLFARFQGNVFRFNPWRGLERFEPAKKDFAPVTVPVSNDYGAGLQNEFKDLQGALRHMDGMLRQQKTALILHGLDQPEGQPAKNADAINAVRAWAQNPDILTAKSVICWITSRPAAAMDDFTLGMTILVRPELAGEPDRREIISKFIAKTGSRVNEEQMNTLTIATAGLNLHQVNAVISKSYLTAAARRLDGLDLETVKRFKSDFIRRSDVLEIEEPSIDFGDVGGYEGVKEMVRKNLIWALRRTQRAELAALSLPRGILIYGPPGTGKTLFAKALSKETSLPFINLKTENLFSKYLGESGQRVRDAIRLVEQASPAIVFVDEIDRFGNRKGGKTDSASQETGRVFAQMLEWLGDPARKSIIVGTTNVPGDLDTAFLRPGRFSYVIPFLYPNKSARKQILEMHLGLSGSRRRPAMDESGIRSVLPEITAETEFYAGADLEEVVVRAKQNFFEDSTAAMTPAHLLSAHKDYRIDTENRRGLADHYKSLGPTFANSVKLLEEMERQ